MQEVFTSARWKLPACGKLIVRDRQAVSPIICQLWQTSHSLQFECLAEQCQMIFQNSFEHPMLKNCKNLHLISQMQLPLVWIGEVFRNPKISAKFHPKISRKQQKTHYFLKICQQSFHPLSLKNTPTLPRDFSHRVDSVTSPKKRCLV